MDDLIKQIIILTNDFDTIVDAIDFDSYLTRDKPEIRESKAYIIYRDRTQAAANKLFRAQDKYIREITGSRGSELSKTKNIMRITATLPLDVGSIQKHLSRIRFAYQEHQILPWALSNLCAVKYLRLNAMQQDTQDDTKEFFQTAIRLANKLLDEIAPVRAGLIDKDTLFQNIEIIELLIYLELSICHSGIPESSLSLGFAEKAKDSLSLGYAKRAREIWKNKHDGDKDALSDAIDFCVAEAQKLSNDDTTAENTFREITNREDRQTSTKFKRS